MRGIRLFTYSDLYRLDKLEHSLGMDSTTDDDESDSRNLRIKSDKLLGKDLGEDNDES